MKKSSAVIIVDEDCNVLLHQRDQNAPINPNRWGLFGGISERDESSVETAVRELKEELSISIDPNDLVYFQTYKRKKDDQGTETTIFYAVYKDSYKPILGAEGKGFGFFNHQEIECLRLSPFVKEVLIDFFKNHEKK